MPTEVELAYAAGILDGEGCISVRKKENRNGRICYYCGLAIAMVDQEVPRWLLTTFGGFLYTSSRKTKAWRTVYIWRVENKALMDFLSSILPYLILKKKRAELAIQLCSMVRKKGQSRKPPMTIEEEAGRREIATQICAANQRQYIQ
jgi:hypothetical protein